MISAVRLAVRVVLYEGHDSEPLDNDLKFTLLKLLLERGFAVSNARSGEQLAQHGQQSLIVLGRFGDRVPPNGTDESGSVRIDFRDLTGVDADSAFAFVQQLSSSAGRPEGKGWKPWFPVIDFGRCTNCMQCLSFCLFDVYGVTTEGKITVQNESNCKTDCPACSRVCPEVAIMFPKYKAGPINGDEINADDLRREAMKVDVSALLGGDIYAMLRDRSAKAKSRFSKERDDERALRERQRCLQKLRDGIGELEIPAEVLASLPSMDEIQAKAALAKRRAQEALEQAQSAANR